MSLQCKRVKSPKILVETLLAQDTPSPRTDNVGTGTNTSQSLVVSYLAPRVDNELLTSRALREFSAFGHPAKIMKAIIILSAYI